MDCSFLMCRSIFVIFFSVRRLTSALCRCGSLNRFISSSFFFRLKFICRVWRSKVSSLRCCCV